MNLKFDVKRLAITAVPPLFAAAVFVMKDYILKLSALMPECALHKTTGLLCPGCGNTRAVRELLSFHFFRAVRYNITVPLLCVFLLAAYAEAVITAWIKPVKIIPRGAAFYIVLGVVFVMYHLLRNLINFMPA